MADGEIKHISDTALWVAAYRAMESERPDALFKDPLAKILAGEQGFKIAKKMPGGRGTQSTLVVRTCVIDEFVLDCVRNRGVTMVVNLAAGLDTRPYRLDLPKNLRWVEVDFPALLKYKLSMLQAEISKCHLEHVCLDLSLIDERRALFSRLASESDNILVMTEGFLAYLTITQVDSLAEDISAQPNFRYWLQDYYTADLVAMINRRLGKHISRTPFQFIPDDWISFFVRKGWKVLENKFSVKESIRLNRQMPLLWLYKIMAMLGPKERRNQLGRMSGYVLFERN